MGSLEGTYDTKLHEAVRYGDVEETNCALQQGYDPNLIGLYQWNALHEAAYNGEEDILTLLLKHSGDPNKADLLRGCTAVHYAAREGHVTCLKLLLLSGGCHDIRNKDGESALDVAVTECREALETLRIQKLSVADPKKQIREECQEKEILSLNLKTEDDDITSFGSSSSFTDRLSESKTSISSSTDGSPALGYLHLSFEYHAKKKSLKIRVWQITDLLLPPPNASMIHSIYVKSFLMPDKKKDSKRKTEEIKVESAEAHLQIKKGDKSVSMQHVYSPATFKFSKPLEYSDISKEAITQDRSVQFEVCITQRYTKRSFLIGLFHISLKSAVKRIVRDKYPLIPCVNHTIPNNMKVYCASQLQITDSAKVFYSNPNIRNVSLSNLSHDSERAVSDPDFTVDITKESSSVNLETASHMGNKDDKESKKKFIDKLKFVKVDDDSDELRVNIPGENELSTPSSGKAVSQRAIDMSSVDIDEEYSKRFRKSHLSKARQETPVSVLSDTVSVSMGSDKSPNVEEDLQYGKLRKDRGKNREEKDSGHNSRPETPTWDYYDMDVSTVDIPLEAYEPPKTDEFAPICLPMETTLGLNTERKSKRGKGNGKDKKGKKKNVPGHAVPVIVITSENGGRKSHRRTPDVSINMSDIVSDSGQSVKSGQIEIAADVHVDAISRMNSETSVEICDSDSFVIDLEENDDFGFDKGDNHDIQAEVNKKTAIPMTVFIDEVYNSDDDLIVNRNHPSIDDHLTSEV